VNSDWPTGVVAIFTDGFGQQDRFVGVDQAGALLNRGTPRSVAVLVRICFTSAGVGEAPWWDLR